MKENTLVVEFSSLIFILSDDLIADTVHGMHGSLMSVNGMETNPYMHHRNGNSKSKDMQIRCKFGQLGANKGQFNSPHGFCLGIDEDIIVADTNNHRVQVLFVKVKS